MVLFFVPHPSCLPYALARAPCYHCPRKIHGLCTSCDHMHAIFVLCHNTCTVIGMIGIVSLHACHEPVSLREAHADSHRTHGLNAARRSGVPRDTIKFRASYSLLIPLECLVLWFVVALHQVQLSDISGPRLDEDVSQSYAVSFVVWFVVQTMLGPRV